MALADPSGHCRGRGVRLLVARHRAPSAGVDDRIARSECWRLSPIPEEGAGCRFRVSAVHPVSRSARVRRDGQLVLHAGVLPPRLPARPLPAEGGAFVGPRAAPAARAVRARQYDLVSSIARPFRSARRSSSGCSRAAACRSSSTSTMRSSCRTSATPTGSIAFLKYPGSVAADHPAQPSRHRRQRVPGRLCAPATIRAVTMIPTASTPTRSCRGRDRAGRRRAAARGRLDRQPDDRSRTSRRWPACCGTSPRGIRSRCGSAAPGGRWTFPASTSRTCRGRWPTKSRCSTPATSASIR